LNRPRGGSGVPPAVSRQDLGTRCLQSSCGSTTSIGVRTASLRLDAFAARPNAHHGSGDLVVIEQEMRCPTQCGMTNRPNTRTAHSQPSDEHAPRPGDERAWQHRSLERSSGRPPLRERSSLRAGVGRACRFKGTGVGTLRCGVALTIVRRIRAGSRRPVDGASAEVTSPTASTPRHERPRPRCGVRCCVARPRRV